MQKIAKIIPYKKMPRGMDVFDYLIPGELMGKLEVGFIVNIPFKKSIIKGVVHDFAEKSEFRYIKEIDSYDNEKVSPKLIEFIEWFSKYYYQSFGSVLKLVLPEEPKRKVDIEETEEQSQKSIDTKSLELKEKKYLIFSNDIETDAKFIESLLDDAIKNGKQILILFPQIYKLKEFVEKCCLRIDHTVIISELKTKKNLQWKIFNKIKKKKIHVILGTRSSVFIPFENLDQIVVVDCENEDYKSWDQNPRFNAVNVVQKIQSIVNNQLFLLTSSPTVELTHLAKNDDYKVISIEKEVTPAIIYDLKTERQSGFTYFSERLIEQLKEMKGKALLIVNKKGLYSLFICSDCSHQLKCPDCKLAFTVTTDNQLVCQKCKKSSNLPLRCPKCNGTNLKTLGIGIDQVKNLLTKELDKKIVICDDEFTTDADVVLVTGQKIPDSFRQKFDLLAFVYIDSLIHLADLYSNQKLYSYIKEVEKRVFANEVIIQTAFPDNVVFQTINSYPDFFKQEIALRKGFNYPPFSRLIKIFYQHHDETICKREADSLYRVLSNLNRDDIIVSEPYLHYTKMVRQRFRSQLIIKLPKLSIEEENSLFKQVPDHWVIDKDPIDLL
jgi:primosomal protein N' (replication factor Y) (superfamily II helicase)